MEGRFNSKEVEQKWFKFWTQHNLFVPSEKESNAPTYSVVIPPPNITNHLHLGHALNNTLQDVMVRYHRMEGFATIWKIGVDHAGIATQNVVEREVLKEGLTKESLGKDSFVKRVWLWKEQYGQTILSQLQRLGVSGDWSDTRFTMDDVSTKAVRELFVKLYNDGLVYRGEYIINWCPHCLTTISDDEVEHQEHQGFLYYVRYYMEQSQEYLVAATTRPETILGDVALAVHPDDDRYKHLSGKLVKVPGTDRTIPVILDSGVEIEFGTGIVKVTPFHDVLDFEIGQRHSLPFIEVLDEHALMNERAGKQKGMDRFDFRKFFVKQLDQQGLIEKTEDYKHSRGICYRCHTVIESRVSTQWFVKMKQLAELAKTVIENKQIQFLPDKWVKVYFHWMNHIKDWSISRQLWWGHSIPAYYCKNCDYIHVAVSPAFPEVCPECHGVDFKADPDVLDTWFSSWIWPFTVFGVSDFTSEGDWETPEFKKYYPTQYLATAPEILFFWVARMIMAGLYLIKDSSKQDETKEGKKNSLAKKIPFQTVFFNSTVCDMQGRKMSKSLGNGIDPIDIIDEHGADALRFTLLYNAPKGERIRLSHKSFDVGSRLVNKLWNAARFVLSHQKLAEPSFDLSTYHLENIWQHWILKRYKETVELCRKSIQSCDYYAYTHTIYTFFWDDFCDWFLESQKPDLYGQNQGVYMFLEHILEAVLRLFHPVMPFITEEIWQRLSFRGESLSISKQRFEIDFTEISTDSALCIACDSLRDLISNLRSLKKDMNIPHNQELLLFRNEPPQDMTGVSLSLDSEEKYIRAFLPIRFETQQDFSHHYVCLLSDDYKVFVQLPQDVDIEKAKLRIQKQIQDTEAEIVRAQGKLSNPDFVASAEDLLVLLEAKKLDSFSKKKQQLEQFIKDLEG